MSTCKRVPIPKKKICIGDLRHKIKVQTRSITAPDDSVDYEQTFTDVKEVWAAITTSKGSEIFDGTNVIGVATHFFYIRQLVGVTFENFVEFNSKRYRILDVQDLNEEKLFLMLRCTERGDKSQNSNSL